MSSKAVITASIRDNPSAQDVAKLMAKNRVGSVVTVDGSKPVGIITERDVLKKVSAENKSAQQVPARDIMSSPLVTVKAIDSIDTAAQAMVKHKVKRLVVLEEDGSVSGMLSVSDIAKKLAKILADDYDRYRSLRDMLDLQ
jgi:CBS domain-containing protein